VTLENFQDISLPIPGKEDLAKLHSAIHQTSLIKAGSCGDAYAPQGWISFVMEYIKRCVNNAFTQVVAFGLFPLYDMQQRSQGWDQAQDML